MWSIPSLPLLPGALWPGVGVPDKVLSISSIELNRGLNLLVLAFKLRISAKLDCLKQNSFDIETAYLC